MAKRAKAKKAEYSLTLQHGGDLYSAEGESMYDALSNLPMPAKIICKSTLLIKHGDKEREMPLTIIQLKRLSYPSGHTVWAKQLAYGV